MSTSAGGILSEAASGKLSREDFKRQKAIEEQRKAGTLPAEVDPETGKDINPHIPHYISQAPWYLDIHHPTLKHQRTTDAVEKESLDQWYQRGKFKGPAAKKYRKGACENCGAMTHKTKDCLDRPRQKGAKFTNRDIAPDEIIQDVNLGFEAKRDRWNGYDPNDYLKIVEEGEAIEAERRRLREEKARQKLEQAAKGGGDTGEDTGAQAASKVEDSGSEDEEDEEKYADAADAVGQKLDAKTRTTVRNLRIREDTAKYLLNLDVNSAYYDPKTRSMRDNPRKDKDPSDLTYAGDNFVRWTGDAPNLAKLQVFAWQAAERGKDVHLIANPTQGELLFQEYQKKKEKVTETQKDSILAKYGGEEYLKAPPKELLLAQTEGYVEYSQTGKIIKGQEKAKVRSKYEEDVYHLNHTSVWGSFWREGRIDAQRASSAIVSNASGADESRKSLLESHLQNAAKGGTSSTTNATTDRKKGRLGEGDVKLDEEKLRKALDEEMARKRRSETEDEKGFLKKKKYSSLHEKEVTEEELEAYRLSKSHAEDPMASYRDEEDD
ncbi:mRNA splicing protein [Phlyctochytrium bullatum]|nr:mRNA splicing protein [Phlyctochytrium bullatum]